MFKIIKYVFLVALAISLFSCKQSEIQDHKSILDFVDPFIGTADHGHVYPGATVPFGMVQLSPDNGTAGWDWCSGYNWEDSLIVGFSHTHLSGTGVSDYGDILLMPTTTIQFNNGADGKAGYRDHFTHENESASPGYYKVHLDSTNIDVELTVSKRSGVHKYAFAKADSLNNHLIIDLTHRDELLSAAIDTLSNTELIGHRHSKAWAENQKLYYYIKTSHPFKYTKQPKLSKKDTTSHKAALTFDNPTNDPIIIKIGISAVDENGAKQNLETEIGEKTFETVKKEGQAVWEKQLEKIIVESDNSD